MLKLKQTKGFTLIEVLVALAVVAISMSALISSSSTSASNAAYLQDKTLAHWVGMNKVAELQLSTTWPSVGLKKGDYELAGQDWRWEAKISSTDDDSIRRLDLKVFRPDSTEAVAMLLAYLGRPLG
ncbi:MAG: type II secretion system minor pseudopilin GspI [Gammaproteobacteria bacterium]|nr:type II secretion system minor pseudopilin GspI [Gammaproteobacteria bacterium]